MAYSIVGILAIAIHLIVNLDVILNLRHKSLFVGERAYFFFLLAVIAYHVTDGVWGFLYDAKNVIAVIIDTDIYFIAMAASILMWSIFVLFQYQPEYYHPTQNCIHTHPAVLLCRESIRYP